MALRTKKIRNLTDYEAEYNNRARVPEHKEIIKGWETDAAAWRTEAYDAQIDLSYGKSVRQSIDIFKPELPKAGPIVLFIHGGYWQALGREWFSHMARGANYHGLTVAIPSYDLCPNVTVMEIIEQMQACCLWLWKRFKRRIVVCGHSAGGHLTACMLATDWQVLNPEAPPLLAAAGLSISGLFDLEPLTETTINDNLCLDVDEARKASPVYWIPPSGLKMIAAVGGSESSEYLRQGELITERWHAHGMAVLPQVMPGENHFTVISSLARPNGQLTQNLVGLASLAT